MANAKIDGNGVRTALATLQSDGVTPIRVAVNPANLAMKATDASTGANLASAIAKRDENSKTVFMGVSSADMVTLVPIAVDASGNLLIQST